MSEPEPRSYKSKTDAELEQLAQDIIAGRVFTSNQVERPEDVYFVFMVLSFLDKDDIDWMKSVPIVMFYEYMDKAGPRGINGYPSFMSMMSLDSDDHRKLGVRYNEIKNFMASRKVEEAK